VALIGLACPGFIRHARLSLPLAEFESHQQARRHEGIEDHVACGVFRPVTDLPARFAAVGARTNRALQTLAVWGAGGYALLLPQG